MTDWRRLLAYYQLDPRSAVVFLLFLLGTWADTAWYKWQHDQLNSSPTLTFTPGGSPDDYEVYCTPDGQMFFANIDTGERLEALEGFYYRQGELMTCKYWYWLE